MADTDKLADALNVLLALVREHNRYMSSIDAPLGHYIIWPNEVDEAASIAATGLDIEP